MGSRADRMQLTVRGVSESYVLNLNGSESLQDVHSAIAEREGSEEVLLYAGGRPLDMEMSAADLAEVSLDVTVPLKGGKVQGQTPKVEAQEKKKKKTGRAKRRIQYNRRFVNVVATFGRKKGPNSNS